MTPLVCANCDHAIILSGDASQPVPGLCKFFPDWRYVGDMRNHDCGQFKMAQQPRFAVPDEEPADEGGDDESRE